MVPQDTVGRSEYPVSSWLPCVSAGLVAVLVGFSSSVAIVFQAATAVGASPQEISSWIFAICVGIAITSIGFTLRYRNPVVTAWSTPGSALLASSLLGHSLSEAIGAFLFSGVLITIFGYTGWFEALMSRVPLALASAMLAGVLLRFGIDAFAAAGTEPMVVLPMMVVFLVLRRFRSRYAVPAVLVLGVGLAAGLGLLPLESVRLELARPVFTWPTFSLPVLLGTGIPLFIVTMASQNIPGVAAIRAAGYDTPISPVIGGTGLVTVLLAPFGAFAVNLAAITASICMGPEAHEDPRRRYIASLTSGTLYLLVGLFAGTVTMIFTALPQELVLALAGLGLLGTIGGSLSTSLREERSREPALITFLVTASGVTFFSVGSAFWGLVAGGLAMILRPAMAEAGQK